MDGVLHAPAVFFQSAFDRVVFFGQAHEFQTDGVEEGEPGGFDYVVGNTNGGPTAFVIAPFD